MDITKDTIISQLYDGTLTISKVPKEFKKDPDVLKAYEEIKNTKLLTKILNKIEKKSDISDLNDSPDIVFRSPEVIKAVLDKGIYDKYKRLLNQRKSEKCRAMKSEYKKYISDNPELYDNIPETIRSLLWSGYDILTDRFVVCEEIRSIFETIKFDTSSFPSEYLFLSFDETDTSPYRFYKHHYSEFFTLKDFLEYMKNNNYDVYSNSCFKYYNFSKAEIKKYKLDIEKLYSGSITAFGKYNSFDEMKTKFEDSAENVRYKKIYDDCYKLQLSGVTRELNEPIGISVRFKYFFEFDSFLRGDLSDANLIFCEGLEKLAGINNLQIDFSNARIISKVREKLNIAPLSICEEVPALKNSEVAAENYYLPVKANSTELSIMDEERELVHAEHTSSMEYNDHRENVFYYCSDLHLADRFNILKSTGECQTHEDEIYLMYKLIEKIFSSITLEASVHRGYIKFLLIDGDVSRDYRLFCMFVALINRYLENNKTDSIKIVFTLGNREYLGMTAEEIDKLSVLIKKSKMYLLQNEILLVDKDNYLCVLDAKELSELKKNTPKLQYILTRSKSIILGGVGFHVNNRYYPNVQCEEFEKLYSLLIKYASNNNVIIMSHYPPIKDAEANASSYQCEYRDLQTGFIYVHGHTHNNFYYNDGTKAVYADCQLYANEKTGTVSEIEVKQFYCKNSFDLFSNTSDGIHKISKDDYKDYMRGKNITMQLNRETDKLYLVKKHDYHCFIHESRGTISIMNGGVMKKIPEACNVQYIYDNLDAVISIIEEPMSVFNKLLGYISRIIKSIGGTGKIHGCIVDIDYFNHIYVNPNDQTITPYSALNMKDKVVYPNIAALLESESSFLYDNMKSLLSDNTDDAICDLAVLNNIFYLSNAYGEVQEYKSTDIYSDSLKIKKMQKLNDGILAVWYDPHSARKIMEDNKRLLLELK